VSFFDRIVPDLDICVLPRDIDAACAKLECDVKHGQRIGWWFKQDEEYAKKWLIPEGESLEASPPFLGLMIGVQDCEARRELELDQCIVIMDTYPAEKHNCELEWVALTRMLDDENLVKVIAIP
jgi:hypothetical protein